MDQPGAPPVDSFTGESDETLWEDWLPTLERAAAWNHWDEEEKLLQLAGHLKGKALQKWNLMRENDRKSFATAIAKLKERTREPRRLQLKTFAYSPEAKGECIGLCPPAREIVPTSIWPRSAYY